MPCIPGGRPVLRRSAPAGWRAGLVRACSRGRLPDRPAPSHRGCHGGGNRARVATTRWRTGATPWRAALRQIWVPHERPRYTARKSSRCHLSGLDPAEPVMYLPWTGDRPVMHPPYTCAGEAAAPGCRGRPGGAIRDGIEEGRRARGRGEYAAILGRPVWQRMRLIAEKAAESWQPGGRVSAGRPARYRRKHPACCGATLLPSLRRLILVLPAEPVRRPAPPAPSKCCSSPPPPSLSARQLQRRSPRLDMGRE